jgi:hypothetical protein
MKIHDIIQALSNLSVSDRLMIAESALKLVLQEQKSLTQDEKKQQLLLASITAISDYAPNGELNVFGDLEGEDFYDYGDEDLNHSDAYV